MTLPLWALAAPTVIGGFIGIPAYLHHAVEGGVQVEFNGTVALISTLAAVGGLGLAYAVYVRKIRPGRGAQRILAALAVPLSRKFWVDEAYGWINQNVQQRLAGGLALFERFVIIRVCVNGVAKLTGLTGSLLRTAQTGKVQTYAAMLLAGLGLLLWLNLR